MSKPFPQIPGRTYMITRMCLAQLFLLHPDSEKVAQIIEFALARARQLTGAMIHSYCTLSDHLHILFTDVNGNGSRFRQLFFSLAGRMINSLRGREGYVWNPPNHDVLWLVDHESQLERIGYIAAQPIAAGVLEKATDWEGAMSSPYDLGTKRTIERPKLSIFEGEKKTQVPDEIELVIEPLPGQAHLPLSKAIKEQLKVVREARRKARAERRASGKGFLGKEALKKISWQHQAKTKHPFKTMNPFVACKDKERRIAALRELKEFQRRYRKALDELLEGNREVVFPYGTNKLRPYVLVEPALTPT